MDRREELRRICRDFGILVVYLFGSRAEDGRRLLDGGAADRAGSDLDVGVVFADPGFDPGRLASLQVALEELFEPLRVDLVPLQRVDALFQFEAVDGHRIAATDEIHADEYELTVMRRAAELLPIQRRLEKERFGVSTA